MFYVEIGLMVGANATFGQFVWHNLIVRAMPCPALEPFGAGNCSFAERQHCGARLSCLSVAWLRLTSQPVAIGNFIGGAFFLGFAQWLSYDAGALKSLSTKVKVQRQEGSSERLEPLMEGEP
eukprot:2821376-Prymnesium_polylepis.1